MATVADEQRRAVLHGAINLVLGCLFGIPYTLIILRDHAAEWSQEEQRDLLHGHFKHLFALATTTQLDWGTERAWRMAHLEGLLNGAVTLILASAFPVLKLTQAELHQLVTALAVCAYGNSFGAATAAAFGVRGFVMAGSAANRAAGLGFMVAMGGIARALQLVIKGSM